MTPRLDPAVYARIAGALLLLTFVAGGFGELYAAPHMVVPGDAAATARNILSSERLYRLGFAAYLVEAMCDVTLTFLLYVLLKPVHANLALLAAFFRIVSTAVFAATELFYFLPLLILHAGYLQPFSPDQVNALVRLSLNLYGQGGGLFFVFYGVASVILGYLMIRSGYIHWAVGAVLAVGGVGFVIRNFIQVLAPRHASDLFLVPMMLAVLSQAIWFLVRGIDLRKWETGTDSVDPGIGRSSFR